MAAFTENEMKDFKITNWYDLSGQVIRDIPTDIRTPYVSKNYPYSPDIQLDGQGNLLVRNGEGALLGTIPYLQ